MRSRGTDSLFEGLHISVLRSMRPLIHVVFHNGDLTEPYVIVTYLPVHSMQEAQRFTDG